MSEITRGAIGMPFEMAMNSELSRRQFHSIAQALLAERDRLERNRDMWKGQVERQAEELALLRRELRVMDVLAEAMAEVKATSDGHSAQPVPDIVAGCLAEIAAMNKEPSHVR